MTKEGGMGRTFCCAIAKSAGNRWREEGRRGRREGGGGGKEGEEGEVGKRGRRGSMGRRGRREGGGGEGGDEGGELCWIQPLQVSWHRLSVSFFWWEGGATLPHQRPLTVLLLQTFSSASFSFGASPHHPRWEKSWK